MRFRLLFSVVFALSYFSVLPAGGQHSHGRGAMSAQDLAKIANASTTGSDAADQVRNRLLTVTTTMVTPSANNARDHATGNVPITVQ